MAWVVAPPGDALARPTSTAHLRDQAILRRTPGTTPTFDAPRHRVPILAVLVWIHLIATGLYVGSTAGLALFTVPKALAVGDPERQRATANRVLRLYDPWAIALLGVMVMTGAWSVTEYKQSLGGDYYPDFGAHLVWKLSLAFMVVMSGTWVTFGIGHRLVRQEDWGEEIVPEKQRSMLGRLRGAAWTTVALTLATIWVAAGRG